MEEIEEKADGVEQEVVPLDMVIANVKKKYTIIVQEDMNNLRDQKKFSYDPGNVTMPRSHADHWYAKSNGTEIVGIPDDGTIKGHTVKMRMQSAISILTKMVLELESVENSVKGTDAAPEVTKATDMVDAARVVLEKLYAS